MGLIGDIIFHDNDLNLGLKKTSISRQLLRHLFSFSRSCSYVNIDMISAFDKRNLVLQHSSQK